MWLYPKIQCFFPQWATFDNPSQKKSMMFFIFFKYKQFFTNGNASFSSPIPNIRVNLWPKDV